MMWITRLRPDKPSHDRRTFECPRCLCVETEVVVEFQYVPPSLPDHDKRTFECPMCPNQRKSSNVRCCPKADKRCCRIVRYTNSGHQPNFTMSAKRTTVSRRSLRNPIVRNTMVISRHYFSAINAAKLWLRQKHCTLVVANPAAIIEFRTCSSVHSFIMERSERSFAKISASVKL